MSLINEALKRAKQAQVRPAPRTAADALLQPVVQAPAARRTVPWLIPASAIGILILAFWCLALWWRRSHELTQVAQLQPGVTKSLVATLSSAPPRDAIPSSNPVSTVKKAELAAGPTNYASLALASVSTLVPSLRQTNRLSGPSALEPGAGATLDTAQVPGTREPSLQINPAPASAPASAFKLQAIFYRLSKASVLINDQTLYLGDEIDNAKVISIERQVVRLLMNGKTNVLRLR